MSIPFRRGALLVALAAISTGLPATPAAALEESRTWREVKTFTAGGGPRILEVDGFRGSMTAIATGGDAVEVVIRETFTGRTKEEIAEVRRQVTLDRKQEGNRVTLYVDGPFRCEKRDCSDGGNRDRDRDRDRDRVSERATYSFELRVPAGTSVDLSTVFGDVRVTGTDGPFKVASVMDEVKMTGVRGAGSARSVNGSVKVVFAAHPNGPCKFETVNGEVDVAFRPGLKADLRFKTMNGEVYTDFPYTPRRLATPAGNRRDGRFVLQQAGAFGVAVGGGGPELAFATINGDILVRNQEHKETAP